MSQGRLPPGPSAPPAGASLRVAGGAELAQTLAELAAACGGPLLALDTSGPTASVALALPSLPGEPRGGHDSLREVQLQAQGLPSEAVMQAIVDVLAAADVRPTALAAVCVGLGPGSFTGLRVSLATCKGLALGADVPLLGGSSLAMVAAGCGPGAVAVVRDARRGDVYVGGYVVTPAGAPAAFLPDARLPVVEAKACLVRACPQGASAPALRFVGDGASLLGVAPAPEPPPRAAYLLLQLAARLGRGERDDLAALAPAYLRPFEPVAHPKGPR